MRQRLLVFASGTAIGGGSGAENLVSATRPKTGTCCPDLDADIVGFVSNFADGGVARRAKRLGVPFVHFPAPWTRERYASLIRLSGADFVALSGWLKKISGHNPKTTFNIHGGPLPLTAGLWGHHVHEKVFFEYRSGRIEETVVTMHFVPDNDEYDSGPPILRCPVPIRQGDTAGMIAERVNAIEHEWQPLITDMVLHHQITWDGKNNWSCQGGILL